MTKKFVLLFFAIACFSTANAQFKDLLKKGKETVGALTKKGNPSQGEVGNGLKEALHEGIKKAVDVLAKEDGYLDSPYKILIPEDARKVTNKLKAVPGFKNVEKTLIEKMNRAAELAADKAKPIFINAIKQMTIKDAMSILMGEKNAATQYLDRTTRQSLYDEFMPVIQTSLDEVNAREYWRGAVNTYNKIPFTSKANPELDDHVTTKALNGLFREVEKKERDIRGNKSSRTSDLLKKVFGKQD